MKKMHKVKNTLAFVGLFLGIASSAQAATLGDWMYNIKYNFLAPFREVFIYGCGVLGIALCGYGLYQIVQKSKPQQSSQISGGTIAASLFCGGLFLVIAIVAATTSETVTGTSAGTSW